MKTLSEMTTGELTSLKDTLCGFIRENEIMRRPTEELIRFRNRVDDELWSRGV